jgi:integrase
MENKMKIEQSIEICDESKSVNIAEWRTSKMGYKFDFNALIWQLDGSISLNLGRMRKMESQTVEGLRRSLCRYAEELSATTTSGVFANINIYFDYTGLESITVKGLAKWRASLTDETECRLGALKAFLNAWNEWGYDGVSSEVVEYLDTLTLKGITKGKAVRRACPYSGPLTSNELGALLDWVSNAFNTGMVSLAQFAYFVTLVFTGRRAVQIRSLRATDLIHRNDANGHDYIVKVPRVKQTGVSFRKAFRSLSVTEDLYLLLKNQSEASQTEVEKILGKAIPEDLRKEIPIFLHEDRALNLQSIEQLRSWLIETPDFLHMTHNGSMAILKAVAVKNQARSERTGEVINFTSRRFRYTKATNLAKRGISGVALAMALDHSDTQHIDVYTANTEEMAEQIDSIMAPILAPLAQAFVGTLIGTERDALRANDPHSRIKNDNNNSVGNCGTFAFCVSGYRACYTCTNFQPWRDAPHEEVLEEILNERERQRNSGVSGEVIGSTDRLLLAVQHVILLCKQKASETMVEVVRG